jgi:DNA-binding NarL/FixJ family response regulator
MRSPSATAFRRVNTATYLCVATVKADVSRLLDTLDLSNRVRLALLVHQAEGED